MKDIRLDSVDRKIIHALQVEPRVPWTHVARVLGVSTATVSRRWSRLRGEGVVWVTGHGAWITGSAATALVEVVADPGRMADVISTLEAIPEVSTILRTTGARDLLIAPRADTIDELWRLIDHRLCHITGIRSLHTHVVVDLSSEGRDWHVSALSESEAAAIPRPALPQPRAARVPSDLRWAILHELSRDGRASATDIGEKWGFNVQRVSDAISALRAEGQLLLQTDVCHTVVGWPVYVWYFVEASASSVQQLRLSLLKVAQVRVVAITAGRYNMILSVWLRNLSSIFEFEVAFSRVAKDARVVDKSVVSKVVKQAGHLVDRPGFATRGIVPMVPDACALLPD